MDSNFSGQLWHTTGKSGKSSISTTLGAFGYHENSPWTRVSDWGQNVEFHEKLNINETSNITETSNIIEITDMFCTEIEQMDSNFSRQLLHKTGKSGKSSISTTVKCF